MEAASNGDVSKPQYEQVYNRLLPYWSNLEVERGEYFRTIKANICNGVLLLDEQCELWFKEFHKYLFFYKLHLSSEDHIFFIKVFFEFIFAEHLNCKHISTAISILQCLLKKTELISNEQLVLDWRKVYSFYWKHFECKNVRIDMRAVPQGVEKQIRSLLPLLRAYYSIDATQQILDQFMPHICPFCDSDMDKTTMFLEQFLPTRFKPCDFDRGWKLWFDDITNIVVTFQNFKHWEHNLVSLLSRLSLHTLGYIDWTPFVPQVFSGFYKAIIVADRQSDINVISQWIVSMIGKNNEVVMNHIRQYFECVSEYCYPSAINDDSTSSKIFHHEHVLTTFTDRLVERLHMERYEQKSWLPEVPGDYKITDKECEEIVNILMPLLLRAMFANSLASAAERAFHNLALICPHIVCEPLKQQFFVSVETVTEPHRLKPTLDCLTAVTRSMIEYGGANKADEILKILDSCIPGIDINDIEKSTSALHLIQAIAVNVPFVEKRFERVAHEFVNRAFLVIDNSDADVWTKSEGIDDTVFISKKEQDHLDLINQTLKVILIQCSPVLFDSVLKRLFLLLSRTIYDPLICGDEVAGFCRSCLQVDPKITLALFFPHFAKLFLELTEDEKCFKEDYLSQQLRFVLCVVSKLCETRAKHLFEYKETLFKIIDRAKRFKPHSGYIYVSGLIRRILVCSTTVWTFDFKSTIDWGKTCEYSDVKIDWSVPDNEDFSFVQQFVDVYLKSELIALAKWRNNEITMEKEECQRRLSIVSDFMFGLCTVLPIWKGEAVPLSDTKIPLNIETFAAIGTNDLNFTNGDNIREIVSIELRKILSHLKEKRENDTKSFILIMQAISEIFFSFGATSEIKYITPIISKNLSEHLKNKLVKSRKHIRFTMVQKALRQHEYRLMKRFRAHQFTTLHKDLVMDLISLAISVYKNVREKATKILRGVLAIWPDTASFIVEELVKVMSSEEMKDNEFEGVLHLIADTRNDNGRSILFNGGWLTAERLWSSFFKTKFRYKEEIIQSVNNLSKHMNHYYSVLNFRFAVTEKCVEETTKGWTTGERIACSQPSEVDIKAGKQRAEQQFNTNAKLYRDLIVGITEAIEAKTLHWKYTQIAFSLLRRLIRDDISLPKPAIKLLVNNLNNDLLKVRKSCIIGVGFILQQQKRKHVKKKVEPFEKQSLQYRLDVNYLDEKTWESTIFVEKTFWCFYKWPKQELFVYDEYSKQPPVNRNREQLTEEERIIFNFFTDSSNIDKLLEFLSLEERKGKDSFNIDKYVLFKRLSRNFGFNAFEMVKRKILALVSHANESKQRCASEIITGLVRGCKHWPLNDVKQLRDYLSPIIESMFKKMTSETFDDWSTFCATCFYHRDTRKFCWFVDLVIKNVMSMKKQTFYNSAATQCLIAIIKQQKWRSLLLLQQLLTTFESRLAEDFRELRVKVGTVLQIIFTYDVKAFEDTLKWSPNSLELIEKILPRFQSYSNANVEENERKKCLNLVKTVCAWIVLTDANPYPLPPQYYKFMPILCQVHREAKDEEVKSAAGHALRVMACTIVSEKSVIAALESCEIVMTDKSWISRETAAVFLDLLLTINFFNLNVHRKTVFSFIFRLLEDEKVEVRKGAQTMLTTAVQSRLIKVDTQLIETLMKKTARPANSGMAEKHCGFMGLCAIIEAFPFDIPPFIPNILVYLSEHLNEPQLIKATIKKTFRSFRSTHLDNWREHKQKFTEEQLIYLMDVLTSANYYS